MAVENWRTEYRVFHGGLMRCCLATLEKFMANTEEPPKEGDVLHCTYHPNDSGMIVRDGAWHWNQPKDLIESENGS